MNRKPQEEVGKTYGKHTILEAFKHPEKNRTYYKIQCDKGHVKDVRSDAFYHHVDFCGQCDRANPHYKSRTYNSWDAMIQRCNNPNSNSYWKYGAVGICCYPEWSTPGGDGWKNFFEYMGECPEGMSLDRYPDKTGNYEPGNVRWATNSEQGYNQKLRSTNKSGKTGVYYWKGKWVARITYNNKDIYLGSSLDFEEAVKLRVEAELKYFGETKE